MAITTLLIIDGTTLTKVKSYSVERNKLWTDAERNMAGDLRATFVGLFPKIVVEFGYTTADELKALVLLLDQASFTLQWWNSGTETLKSGTYYAGDYATPILDKTKELYKPFSVNLIPFSKMT